MILKVCAIMTVVASITNSAEGSPHHHNDPYTPVIHLLKELRKAKKHGGGGLSPIRDDFTGASAQNPQFQFPTGNSGSGNGGGNGGNSPPTPILTPGGGSSSSGSNYGSGFSTLIPQAAGPSSNFPPILPNIPSGSQVAGQLGVLPPYPIEQVNRGVGTILQGVRSFDLGQILRGAFIFPRNENVRNVANNVLDNIFGSAKPAGGSGGGSK